MVGTLNLIKIYDLSKSDNFITQLQSWGLIHQEPNYMCPKCDSPMKLMAPTGSKCDDMSWRCRQKVSLSKQKAKQCDTEVSLRTNTFFCGSHLSLFQILGFVNLWVDNCPQGFIMKQLEIDGKQTVTDWSSFCREVVYDAMILKKEKIGGPGKVVQIDESKFGKRKYNRGHKVDGQWVFEGFEEGSGKVFMVPVDKRDSETLVPIIEEWIEPGTTIVSDYWRAYAYDCLELKGFRHLKVNHSINFKDPITDAHTNHIEASWRAAKATMPGGIRRKFMYPSNLAKYMFMKMCRVNSLDPTTTFFKLAGELYNPMNPNDCNVDLGGRDIDIETEESVDFD